MKNSEHLILGEADGLVIVDLQNDFLPGGSLAVPHGDEILPVVSALITAFSTRGLPVFATRCWHPADHCSFKPAGGPWPPHCVAGTSGAAFPPGLVLPESTRIISKATQTDQDAYSGFEGTNLDSLLREAHVRRLFVAGLATDYCVLNTVKDGLKLGYGVIVVTDGIRAVDVQEGDGQRAIADMGRLGAQFLDHPQMGN